MNMGWANHTTTVKSLRPFIGSSNSCSFRSQFLKYILDAIKTLMGFDYFVDCYQNGRHSISGCTLLIVIDYPYMFYFLLFQLKLLHFM